MRPIHLLLLSILCIAACKKEKEDQVIPPKIRLTKIEIWNGNGLTSKIIDYEKDGYIKSIKSLTGSTVPGVHGAVSTKTVFTRDKNNRITQHEYTDELGYIYNAYYKYNDQGQIDTIRQEHASQVATKMWFIYDNKGRLKERHNTHNGSSERYYSYNNNGNITEITTGEEPNEAIKKYKNTSYDGLYSCFTGIREKILLINQLEMNPLPILSASNYTEYTYTHNSGNTTTLKYKYNYNTDGYPVKQVILNAPNNSYPDSLTYTYEKY